MANLIDPTLFQQGCNDPSFTITLQRLVNAINTAWDAAPEADAAHVTEAIGAMNETQLESVKTDLAIIPDAPSDDSTYGRRNGDWTEITTGDVTAQAVADVLPDAAALLSTDNKVATRDTLLADPVNEAALCVLWGMPAGSAGTTFGFFNTLLGSGAFPMGHSAPRISPLPYTCRNFRWTDADATSAGYYEHLPLPQSYVTGVYEVIGTSINVTSSDVDAVLARYVELLPSLISPGSTRIDLTGCPAPSTQGMAAVATLQAAGCAVTVTPTPPIDEGFVEVPSDGTPILIGEPQPTYWLWSARGDAETMTPTADGASILRGLSRVENNPPEVYDRVQSSYPVGALWPATQTDGALSLLTDYDSGSWIKFVD